MILCPVAPKKGLALHKVFQHAHALNTEGVPQFATNQGTCPRLAPAYREHLFQAFAWLLMRVGLPTDIPAFGRKE